MLDAAALGSDPRDRALELFANGVDWIQLRDRSLDDETFWTLARVLVEASGTATIESTRGVERSDREGGRGGGDDGGDDSDGDGVSRGDGHGVSRRGRPAVIVNKRIDLAWAAGAHAVHLGFDSLPVRIARSLLPPGAWVGASLHSVEEIKALATELAGMRDRRHVPDYVHLAPIWNPRSKPATRPALGPAVLREACAFGIPVIAQGGVDPVHAEEAIRAGATGVAVSGLLMETRDVGSRVRALRKGLDRARTAARD